MERMERDFNWAANQNPHGLINFLKENEARRGLAKEAHKKIELANPKKSD
jgi:hypothetical protein